MPVFDHPQTDRSARRHGDVLEPARGRTCRTRRQLQRRHNRSDDDSHLIRAERRTDAAANATAEWRIFERPYCRARNRVGSKRAGSGQTSRSVCKSVVATATFCPGATLTPRREKGCKQRRGMTGTIGCSRSASLQTAPRYGCCASCSGAGMGPSAPSSAFNVASTAGERCTWNSVHASAVVVVSCPPTMSVRNSSMSSSSLSAEPSS